MVGTEEEFEVGGSGETLWGRKIIGVDTAVVVVELGTGCGRGSGDTLLGRNMVGVAPADAVVTLEVANVDVTLTPTVVVTTEVVALVIHRVALNWEAVPVVAMKASVVLVEDKGREEITRVLALSVVG